MDNDEMTKNAKISDSAYSASYSSSQSRSRSSKSTHSGSNSSGSSGYGGQASTSCSNSIPPPAKKSKDKDSKKKKPTQTEVQGTKDETECITETPAVLELPKEEKADEVTDATAQNSEPSDEGPKTPDVIEIETKEEVVSSYLAACNPSVRSDAFSCVISMHDGVVMYTTTSLTATLGFPKDMWIGRSFIDFVHVRDRNTFASQITNGLADPTTVNGTLEKVHTRGGSISTMVCRIRRYRGLMSSFGVKEREVTFMPFLLKLTFKNVNDEAGEVMYLVVQATALYSAFKEPNEIVTEAVPFVMRHAADGKLEYIDPESVPYLGYLPQDILGKDMIQLYHQDDLPYLTQVYETIVKNGGLARSKPYRMMTQNRDCVKLETEWSSFINPWSRKLEFVIGKHHIIEGPTNPDIFSTPDTTKAPKISEEEKKRRQEMRDDIIKIMNNVLTKPAKLAKQLKSKRCQDLASFMESLIEDLPKANGELRVDIDDQDNNCYERDSMLGGISPHHDCNDSKSSTETPPSYNRLNYNETLQRYFERHQPLSIEDYNNVTEEHNILSLKNTKLHYSSPNCSSPLTQTFGDAGDIISSCESSLAVPQDYSPVSPLSDQQQPRLTESLLSTHNADMEREMLRLYRETRISGKGGREKVIADNRHKKNEHLARCNAVFEPTEEAHNRNKLHGVKRSSKPVELDTIAHKHHCPTSRQPHRRHTTSTADVHPSATITTSMASSNWHHNSPVKSTNAFLIGVGLPQQLQMMDTALPQQMIAMPAIPMQCLMYGQTMYGSPIMYSAIAPQVSFPMQHTMMSQTMRYTNLLYNSQPKPQEPRDNAAEKTVEGESVEAPTCSNKPKDGLRVNEETVDKTDGESSYSSFYSSFFKTESGSAEESEPKKVKASGAGVHGKGSSFDSNSTYVCTYDSKDGKKKAIPRRKLEPKWMEQVCVTSELIYKYQILTKSMEEVLSSDKEKINELTQPSLVNEQLGQLYLDLQLEGVQARLTLEEGITSSSSSGEETSSNIAKDPKRKRELSQLVMIYEEDAPFPSPDTDDEINPVVSTT